MSPMRDGRTNERTREDRATQPMDAGWLSFAKRTETFLVFTLGGWVSAQNNFFPIIMIKKTFS